MKILLRAAAIAKLKTGKIHDRNNDDADEEENKPRTQKKKKTIHETK